MEQFISPTENPDLFKHFAYIVDGDVAHIERYEISSKMMGIIACLQSNPQIIEVTGDLRSQINLGGWTYDGTNFISPNGQ